MCSTKRGVLTHRLFGTRAKRSSSAREARQALEEVGLGVYGNTVRSPKVFLGKEVVSVGGVDRSPVDIVADVIRHVRAESKRQSSAPGLGGPRPCRRDDSGQHERAPPCSPP